MVYNLTTIYRHVKRENLNLLPCWFHRMGSIFIFGAQNLGQQLVQIIPILLQLRPFITYNWLFLWLFLWEHSINGVTSIRTYKWYNSGHNCGWFVHRGQIL